MIVHKSYLIVGSIILLLVIAIFSGVIETETVRYESSGEVYAYELCINHGKSSTCPYVTQGVITFLSAIGVTHIDAQIMDESRNPFQNPFGTPE